MEKVISLIRDALKDNHTIKAVADKGLEKLAASVAALSIMDLWVILCGFVALAVIDIATRYLACSAALWRAMYGPEITKARGNIYMFYKWIPVAHKFRYIDSHPMRSGFLSKMTAYLGMLGASFIVDLLLAVRGLPQVVLGLTVSVLSLTELLSICENLGEANIEVARSLKELVQKKKDAIK